MCPPPLRRCAHVVALILRGAEIGGSFACARGRVLGVRSLSPVLLVFFNLKPWLGALIFAQDTRTRSALNWLGFDRSPRVI
jgi:hypothetical protein